MEIHSSSLRTPPTQAISPARQVSQIKPVTADEKAGQFKPAAQYVVPTQQTIEQLLAQAGLTLQVSATITGNNLSPVPTKVQQALNLYQACCNQPLQEQRAALLAGVDFYV